MTILYAAILALAANPGEATPTDGTQTSVASTSSAESTAATSDSSDLESKWKATFPQRSAKEMRTRANDALRANALAKTSAQREQTARQLMLVLLELEQDHNLTHDERVELHGIVQARLMSIEKTLKSEMARSDRAGNRSAKAAISAGADQGTKPIATAEASNQPTLSAAIQSNSPGNIASAQVAAKENLIKLAQLIAPLAQVGQAPVVAGRAVGAAGVVGNQGQQPAANQQNADAGPELVALIQMVVSPRTWDVNGGPGTIVYYQNLHVLVVTAPAEAHGQIGDVLGQLRK